MKKVICDHAGECDNTNCVHREEHRVDRFEGEDCDDSATCLYINDSVRCVEAPDDAS